jgi:hypothetical protein
VGAENCTILEIDPGFTPCPVSNDDELYPNGIFEFNITKFREYIQKSTGSINLEEVAVKDFFKGFSSIDESYVGSVDISLPVFLAEISPALYSLIDGHHKMEKARRMGVKNIPAYKL